MEERDTPLGVEPTQDGQFKSQVTDLALADQIDLLCDQFEQQCKDGLRPAVPEYLARVPAAGHADLLEYLLFLDIEYRTGRGEQPTVGEYTAALPQYAELVRQVLSQQQTLPWTPVDETVAYESAPVALGPTAQEFGDYDLLEELGRGGMGVVYRAHQKSLNRQVAVKLILPGRFAGTAELQRFRAEAEAAANLQHSGIVSVFEIGEHGGHPFFSMEVVTGANLNEAVKPGPLPPRQAAELVRQTAEIIEFAHQHGVVHRDLKPANVLLDENGKVRVTDFGLAKRSDDDSSLTTSGDVLGTPCYMPPEQAEGRIRDIGPRSDVYALGAILYCLLTGRPPFQTATLTETLKQVIEKEPVSPRRLNPDVPLDLSTICCKCLEKKPEARYPSAQALVDELDRFLADEPIAARPIGPVQRTWRWCRRKPALATVALLLLVMAVVISPSVAIRERVLRQRLLHAEQQEMEAQTNALFSADPEAVPSILSTLRPTLERLVPRLQAVHRGANSSDSQRLRAALALASYDPIARDYLQQKLVEVEAAEFLPVRQSLAPFHQEIAPRLWPLAASDQTEAPARFRAACALAHYDPENARWEQLAPTVAQSFVAQDPFDAAIWLDALRPLKHRLFEPLSRIAMDQQRAFGERMLATRAIAHYAANDPAELVPALVRSDSLQWEILFPVVEQMRQSVLPLLVKELRSDAVHSRTPHEATESQRDAHASRRANAAIALVRFGQADEVWPLLKKMEDCRLRTYLIHRWQPLGVSPEILLQQLDRTQDVSQHRALLLSLGTFPLEEVSQAAGGKAAGRELIGRIERMLREHPDAGIHGAARWLLTQWGHQDLVAAAINEFAGEGVVGDRQWYVHPEKLTLVNFPQPAPFWMGSRPTEPYRDPDESRQLRHIDRDFSIATTEITRRQFSRFLEANAHLQSPNSSKYSPSPLSPRVVVTWFEAAAFCNWLSQQEGLPKDQWCYPPYQELTDGQPLPANWLERTGYRLPTEAEWEYACRAGAGTPRYYGHDESLLGKYAWYLGTRERVAPVAQLMPNDFGLFDTHGNAWEWCCDPKEPYPKVEPGQVVRDRVVGGPVSADENRVLRSGGITSGPRYIRSADRSWYPADYSTDVVGFRPARTLPAE